MAGTTVRNGRLVGDEVRPDSLHGGRQTSEVPSSSDDPDDRELYPAGMLRRSRGHPPASVVVAAFDLDDVRAPLPLMLRRESVRAHASLREAPPQATTKPQPAADPPPGHG